MKTFTFELGTIASSVMLALAMYGTIHLIYDIARIGLH